MNEKEVLERAIDAIHENGWAKEKVLDEEGKICFLGALYKGAGFDLNYGTLRLFGAINPYYVHADKPTIEILININRVFTEKSGSAVSVWNDLIARDADDVIHAMKRLSEEFDD